MPDFSLCSDTDCPSRKTCKRATTSPSAQQWYIESPRDPGSTKCHLFMLDEKALGRQIINDLHGSTS